MAMNDSHLPRPKRRWYQFSLRTLLVFVLVLSVPLAWLAMKMQKARKEREAEKAILKAGGVIFYDSDTSFPVPTRLHVSFVDPFRVNITDDVLVHVKELANRGERMCLHLGGTQVTDAGLENLKGLTSLEELWLRDTNVTDAGLKYLEGLTSLEWLELAYTNVTDAGLDHLKGLSSLEDLNVRGTQVTDRGLEYLKGLTRLKSLDVVDTNVTDEGVKKLQRALPNCKIEH